MGKNRMDKMLELVHNSLLETTVFLQLSLGFWLLPICNRLSGTLSLVTIETIHFGSCDEVKYVHIQSASILDFHSKNRFALERTREFDNIELVGYSFQCPHTFRIILKNLVRNFDTFGSMILNLDLCYKRCVKPRWPFATISSIDRKIEMESSPNESSWT